MALDDQDLSQGIDKPCKENQSGVNTIYVFPYIKYNRNQVSLSNHFLSSYPNRNVYEYKAQSISFNENAKITNGGVEWSQSLSFKIPLINSNIEVNKLNYMDYCIIFKDRQGVLRLMGLWNGATVESSSTSGLDKGSFSGYEVKATAKETQQAPYMTQAFFNNEFSIQ